MCDDQTVGFYVCVTKVYDTNKKFENLKCKKSKFFYYGKTGYMSVFRQPRIQTGQYLDKYYFNQSESRPRRNKKYLLFILDYLCLFSILIGSYSICLNTDEYEYAAV